MTTTITTTILKPAAVRLPRVDLDALTFFKEQLSKKCFAVEQKTLINDLIANYEDDDAPQLLILFLSQILYPLIENSDDTDLEEMDTQVKNILRNLLPPGTNIDDYIAATIAQNDDDFASEAQALKIAALCEKKDDLLCDIGDQSNRNIDQCHESLKNRMLKIIQVKEKISEELVVHNNREVETINLLKAQLNAIAEEFTKIGMDYQQQQKKYQELLSKSRELVTRIRR